MQDTAHRAIAIVGAGAIMPDAPNVASFWNNIKSGRDSIAEVSPDRWDPALYYHPDHSAPDKTYSKIGGWVREYPWDPFQWRLAIPPRVADAMDGAQRWGIACTREALADYGYPERPLNTERTAVILGNAMAGEMHYFTALRAFFPEYERELDQCASFAALPAAIRSDIAREWHARVGSHLPPITEDSMPGELANCLAGRIANIYNFRGPNFTCDAACASAMAAVRTAAEGLIQHDFDVALTGGIDRNMGASTFIKFSKIGALSATGSRPYAEGADGFVMGEGAALFLIKRLADAEREGDKIYAVIRGIGASSDGKGKGITAPNPAGQKLAIGRAWQNAGVSPHTATLIEGHGTSTSVGDVVEVESIAAVLKESGANGHTIALGSVKSNIGHLKGASGAAGMLKTALALRDKVLPPSVHCEHPNPNIDFAHSPLAVNTELRPWTETAEGVRRAGVSAFGFGGTNFHVVMEEYVPHRLTSDGKRRVSVQIPEPPATPRGALVAGAVSESALVDRVRQIHEQAKAGQSPARGLPAEADLHAPHRLAIDYADAAELADKTAKALKAFETNQPPMWKALQAQGIFRGQGPAPKVAFLYPGQGSQYVNMLQELRAREPIVAHTFAEADDVMTPLLGKPLSDYIFIDGADPAAVAKLEEDLRQTAITQPAVLASDIALTRLLASYGIQPDMTMGHSLGEYGALVAAGALPFAGALEAVSARGREMTRVAMADNGRMAAVFAPLDDIETILKKVAGYVVIANINSQHQAVIGGHTKAIEDAVAAFRDAGYEAVELPVSHAFHTSVVAPASEPMRRVLERLYLQAPRVPTVANLDGEFYPTGPDVVPRMLDILSRQIASPVQFVKGLHTLYAAGARIFIEVGPKKALHGFVEDVLGGTGHVMSIFTNHPKSGDVISFNQALCGMYAWGLGKGEPQPAQYTAGAPAVGLEPADLPRAGKANSASRPVVITGAALGLPGEHHIFDDANVERLLRGDQFIDVIPMRFRRAMLDKHITRLVKNENGGNFETITDSADVLKLAGRGGPFDLTAEFGIPADRVAAMDRTTRLAIAVGLEALRDAGIPLVMRYKTATTGAQLPDRWSLPDVLRDETGVIFACVFPGYDSFADEAARYYNDRSRRDQLATLESLRARSVGGTLNPELDRRIAEIRAAIEKEPYVFDRRFLFHTLSMGHSQFAELIGARGPNTQINAACATTTQAVGLAEDWIAAGRCRRVVIISADDVSSDNLLEWFGAGFLASGAAATDDVVENAAVPFDRRRHGMIIGMGAAALVVERADAAAERGLRPICEVLSAVTANSAFHGTRLDPAHIAAVMETLVARAERCSGVSRKELAKRMVFVSHETYTPARGGSASAEIHALRKVFDGAADSIVIANTKGFTGHAMGAGIEDVLAVKSLETGSVPPVANFKEVDPELGPLNLSRGGAYPVEYSLRLGAGFGSQISMTILRRLAAGPERPAAANLGYAYRIADPAAWQSWLRTAAGGPAELEVAHRTLRIRDARQPNAAPAIAEPIELHVPQPAVKVAAPQSVAAPKIAETSIRAKVLDIVAEKTGYPIEMLALDLDLEADLGIDTVKQAEMFAAVREVFGIPRDPNLKLRDFPTLAHVLRFAEERGTTKPVLEPSAVATASTSEPSVRDKVLAIVAEKTGYPIEMLALDLDLEADLGIDTVKQAEMFAAVRETFGIARDPNLKLRDFPTLAHVMQFAGERGGGKMRPAETVSARATVPPPAPALVAPPENPVRDKVLAIVAEKTGYPIEMLALDLDLEADLGIDTVKQAEMFAAVRETFGIARDPNLKLRDFPTLAHVMQFAGERGGGKMRPAETVSARATVPPPAPALVAPPENPVRDKVLAIVAEKTGYPIEMLDPDLDLEADLGIDTVKQAEMFASVRQVFNIARDTNMKLRDFPTLGHVIRFAEERSATATQPPQPEAPPLTKEPVAETQIPGVARRIPMPVLRPPLTLCKMTAASLEPGRRVLVVADRGGVAEALSSRLRSLGVEVLDQPDGAILHGIYWLPALDPEGPLNDLDLPAWREALRLRVKSLYALMRERYEQIAQPGSFLITATRLGGKHGYGDTGAFAPLGGAVTGFAKAYKRERTDALVKAVDFEAAANAADIAELLIEETLRDPGEVEIGYCERNRWTVGLENRPANDGRPGIPLGKDTVFVITGAAGSIVSAITADLAAASGATFHLLDLTPAPQPGDPDLLRLATDREALKRDIFARLQAQGQRATPALVEKEIAALERAEAASQAIQAVEAAGGTPHYYSVDLTSADAVAKVMDDIRRRSGRVDVVLHAAGIERSHFLPDKDPREFDLVFDVKSDGWFNVMLGLRDMPLQAIVAFSSIAGRFGNAGQTDYSAANDLLCKLTSSFRTTHPETRAIAIDWTAWAGIGMASRGSIPQMMKLAGIDMLPPEAGVPWIRRELTDGAGKGEVVVAGQLGILLQDWDETAGLAPDAITAGPMLDRITAIDRNGLATFECTLDPRIQPFLYDHQIDATPVLPGVMGIEAFAEAAKAMAPEWHVASIEEMAFLAPFKFYRHEPRTLTVEADFHHEGGDLIAECRLLGRRTLPNVAEPQVTIHFTGRVRLTKAVPASPASVPAGIEDGPIIEAADIYHVYFHGPAYQVIRRAWCTDTAAVGEMSIDLPADHQPEEQPLSVVPRLIELCFQTAGLWEMSVHHRMGLPWQIERVSFYRAPQLGEVPIAIVTPSPSGDSFTADVIDQDGNPYIQVSGYRTIVFLENIDAGVLRGLEPVRA